MTSNLISKGFCVVEFLDTVSQIRANWQPYKKWEHEQACKNKQSEILRQKYPPTKEETEHGKEYGRTIVNAINIMDQHSIDKAEDASFVVKNATSMLISAASGVGFFAGLVSKLSPKCKNNRELVFYWQIIGAISGGTIASVFSHIYGAAVEKQASRVARFQTRENDLKDPRHFVIYTKEQIKEAEKITKKLPEIKETTNNNLSLKSSLNPIKTFTKAYHTTKELNKDYSKYLEWRKKFNESEKAKQELFKTASIDEEKLTKAKKDRDVMLNTIKTIETYSLDYLNDMKMALFVVIAGVGALSVAFGAGLVKILDLVQKHSKNIKKESSTLNITKAAGVNYIPIITSLIIIGPMIKLLKDSTRVGRFKAKQNLLSNPQNFVPIEEKKQQSEKMPKVEKKDESFIEKTKKDFTAVKNLKNDYFEYKKYLKTQHQEELKLQEALKQIKTTEQQEIDAKKLQKNAFHSFEKMDEKAQRFTDDSDAAVDTGRSIINSIMTACVRIFSLSLLLKKMNKYNLGTVKDLKEVKKAISKLKTNDIFQIVAPLFIPAAINIPIAIKGIQIKKQSSKIGIMVATNDLENPLNFADEKDIKN